MMIHGDSTSNARPQHVVREKCLSTIKLVKMTMMMAVVMMIVSMAMGEAREARSEIQGQMIKRQRSK